jgi:glyceraldehyde-3-phosphate dehydrogenase (NADP+)
MMDDAACLSALNAAQNAYKHGRGEWPSLHPGKRIAAVEKYIKLLKTKREEIIDLIMWEICKNTAAATSEFDRTIKYVEDTLVDLKRNENSNSTFNSTGGIVAQIRRAPIGVVLCSGPFNYPFNETYTTLIPAIIMGNAVIMKLPRNGLLCHRPTFDLFRDCFPKGVINIISGSGRATIPPIMSTGQVDVFAFIGTSKAAAAIQKAHPQPHRLRVCLGLDAKNPAIVLPDADLDVAVKQCILGSLSYNGQRCTAIKIIFVHESIHEKFVPKLAAAMDALKLGMPWEADVSITPLPEKDKPAFLKDLIEDAVKKGAKIVNPRGGKIDRSLVAPTMLFPVTPEMRVFREEQFGPVVPVATYKDIHEVYDYLATSQFGQQAAVFSTNVQEVSKLVDVLVNQVSRVNLNSQCQRGPDNFPFTGRKDSAYGTLSVTDALRVFSIRCLVAANETPANTKLLTEVVDEGSSTFLRMDYLF